MALRLHNKKWYPCIFLIGSAAVVAGFHLATVNRPDLLLSCIVAVAGFTYFLYRQQLDETKLFKDLFVEFNERYDKMNDGLNKILYGPPNGDLSRSEMDLLFRYFNLCSEEYLFYNAGYIDQQVWKSWSKGMDIFFKHPRVSALWESERGSDSYYGFTRKPPNPSPLPKLSPDSRSGSEGDALCRAIANRQRVARISTGMILLLILQRRFANHREVKNPRKPQ
jgi:hypothetical protein